MDLCHGNTKHWMLIGSLFDDDVITAVPFTQLIV